jgi:hypothetical protein
VSGDDNEIARNIVHPLSRGSVERFGGDCQLLQKQMALNSVNEEKTASLKTAAFTRRQTRP